MTAREELIVALMSEQHAPMSDHDPRDGSCRSCPWPLCMLPPPEIADALIAEGWRKMPSREAIARVLSPNTFDTGHTEHRAFRSEGLLMADAILALMEGADDE